MSNSQDSSTFEGIGKMKLKKLMDIQLEVLMHIRESIGERAADKFQEAIMHGADEFIKEVFFQSKGLNKENIDVYSSCMVFAAVYKYLGIANDLGVFFNAEDIVKNTMENF